MREGFRRRRVESPDGGLPSDTPAIYSAGFLLFHRGATLVAQPFDERTLRLSGEPQAITTETAPGTPVTIAAFDASKSGTLVFVTTSGGVRAAQNWDLWAVDLRSGAPTRLTRQPGIDSDPVWSPDGAALRVSTKIAAHPLWRGDGRELFWMGPSAGSFPFDTLFSADLAADGATVRSAGAKPLLPAHVRMSPLTDSRSHFAVARDGQRFLLRQADGVPDPAVKMILNWPAMVRRD